MSRRDLSPDAGELRAFVRNASRRAQLVAGAEGAAVGTTLALFLTFAMGVARDAITVSLVILAVAAVLGAAVHIAARKFSRLQIALSIEEQVPASRNVILTATELLDRSSSVRPQIMELVQNSAARITRDVSVAALFPFTRAFVLLALSLLAWSSAFALVHTRGARASGAAGAQGAPALASIEVTVVPPAYTRRSANAHKNPERINALAGSTLKLSIAANADVVTVESLTGIDTLSSNGRGVFTGEVPADADGFLAFQPIVSGLGGVRRLVGVSVAADAAPRVRITAPGKDLYLPDAKRRIEIGIEATDDIALASLQLRYTKSSGSGERFTFTDGEVPVQVERTDSLSWKATAEIDLASMTLVEGDIIVYRAVAADGRPGAVPSESDTYIIEIAAPGAIAAGGFAIDEEQDRYAISQQMVILKTERLLARKDSMSSSAIADEAANIAAEQRKVRAEFVFMMGGELAEEIVAEADMMLLNEEAHAEADAELGEGRLANQGRLELIRAIRAMSHAAALLIEGQLPDGLAEEKRALVFLQRTFARNRYILRALTERERLDLTRRLTGSLSTLTRDAHPAPTPETYADVNTLKRALADVASLASAQTYAPNHASIAMAVAERVLRVNAALPELQQIAATLGAASRAIESGRAEQARDHMDKAATAIATVIRSSLQTSVHRKSPLLTNLLGGAFTDALDPRSRVR